MSRAHVSICIPSYRRPEGLFALLGALDGLVFDGETPEIQLVVVDNDAEGSAWPVCENARSWLRHPLRYVVEKRKGIPIARNAAVAAGSDAQWIAFVDDDETPEPRWLEALLRTQRECAADVVTGPVVPRFAAEPPRWVLEGGFFASLEHATGEVLHSAYTNNVLVRTACLDALPSLFDERFQLGVGEDRELFERIAARGGRIVWCREARVYERVPAERARLRWLLRRGFRVGASNTHITRLRADGPVAGRVAAHGAWCVARGTARAVGGVARGPVAAVRGLQLAAFGLGRVAGLLGLR
ncbi:MAG: glycosyltransferase family 2 protein [Myxococcota bacterium]